MVTRTEPKAEPRTPLSRDRVLRAAIKLADDAGIEALSMRKLGQELGVEAMSLYNHVANKEEILDGMVDVVVSEIIDAQSEIDLPTTDWKTVLRQRVLAAREIFLRHRWAPGVIESRSNMSTTPAMLRYYDSLIGLFREAGFSIDLTHHALHVLGSRALGFTQDLYDDSEEADDEAMAIFLQQAAGEYPHIIAMAKEISHDDDTTLGSCDDQVEFEFALDLMLDGLERLRNTA
ncbi:MAG: TetR/AcrR family transcriptional regulator C-terminal domain-containing protein [Actinomycetota bacterium]|nr:TetR/AcrR family transcriptional regulator C-terminal domain-containing protein [Actinomycetota bacterium]